LTQQEYLVAGFSSLATASRALKANIGIPVVILARVMWYAENAKRYVTCPYLILEQERLE
jgi:hypothetical protein